ncbi:MAG: phosphoribosyl-AMP cyclohydrolase [Hyphomicrobiaceae bacterium]
MSATGIETTSELKLRYDANGLVPAIATDAKTGEALMLAYMNAAALERTLATGVAHFWSRSRGALWRKGETSGNELKVLDVRVDCDQDAIWLRVAVAGDGVACHTGAVSCFYRRIGPAGADGNGYRLVRVDD